jgi:D-alanyl-D-alanine-carboxypeptidase/D-alanyl-D-alanine-endopeptidase
VKRLAFSIVIGTSVVFAARGLWGSEATLADADVESLLKERVALTGQGTGIIVGIVDASGSKIISHGKPGQTTDPRLDGNTVFEIGSATKVFTALLLADMVEHGEISLDDPVSKYLPASVKVPGRKDRQITLLDLATHTSGLPRLPDNLTPTNANNPYADYTVEQMYAFLSGYVLTRDIGAEYEYSNLGAGLLGHILARKAGTNYETLVTQRICRPLGMSNTRITLSPGMKARLAVGHAAAGEPAANWDLPTLAGAGALRSTANDLLKFLAANLGLAKADLFPAMQLAQKPRHAAMSTNVDIGLGWHISKKYGTEIVWHNGGTGGYHSFLGFDPRKKRGVVVLVNSARTIDDWWRKSASLSPWNRTRWTATSAATNLPRAFTSACAATATTCWPSSPGRRILKYFPSPKPTSSTSWSMRNCRS